MFAFCLELWVLAADRSASGSTTPAPTSASSSTTADARAIRTASTTLRSVNSVARECAISAQPSRAPSFRLTLNSRK